MTNKRRPFYPDDSDYNTNAPSYYDDLARKSKLIKLLAERIWEYENTLNETLEDIEKRLTDYITENDSLMNERLENWDKRIEDMPEEMRSLFVTWLNDGTLEQIINHDVLGNKADKTYVDIKLNGKISVEEFPIMDSEVDDTGRINRALTFLSENDNATELEFAKKSYTVSGSLADNLSITNKTINGNYCTIVDKRKTFNNMFLFNNSENVLVQNFNVISDYDYTIVGKTILNIGNFIVFDRRSNNIKIKNISMINFAGNGIWIAPREGEDATNIEIENIVTDHLMGHTIFLSSLDHPHRPSTIKGVSVKDVFASYNGAFYNEQGVSTRNPSTHWTTGIDYGEALDLLENATFTNCHVSYASESGFHVETGSACINVQFHNCSSRFNGAREDSVYGFGWVVKEGVSLINCITEGNNQPHIFYKSSSIHESGDTYHIDIYDNDYGKIVDNGQEILTFDTTQELSLISKNGDKKVYNYFDVSTTVFGIGHFLYSQLAQNKTDYNYYLDDRAYSDVIKIDRDSLYKVVMTYRKTNQVRDNINIVFRNKNYSDGSHPFIIDNDMRPSNLNKIFTNFRTIKFGDYPAYNDMFYRILTDNEVFDAKLIKLFPDVDVNLLENPLMNDTKAYDFKYAEQNQSSTMSMDLPNESNAYKVVTDSDGKWITTNPATTQSYFHYQQIHSHDYPVARNQKLEVIVAYKSDLPVDNVTDYLDIGVHVHAPDRTIRSSKYVSIKDIDTTQNIGTFIIPINEITQSDKDYFSLKMRITTDKSYYDLVPIKFRVLSMKLIH